ncbi:MAG: hypothetical protein U0359_04125 [Byssovorax sp.]
MHHAARAYFRPLRPFLAALALTPALAGCNSESKSGACTDDPPGDTFTFHVHNGGASALDLTFGCGASLPIVLDTDRGAFDIGPGPSTFCENKCDAVYAGQVFEGCTDCGGGVSADLDPGKTVDIAWDRRVYDAIMVDRSCTVNDKSVYCARGTAVRPTASQTGTLTVCTSAFGSYCDDSDKLSVSFTIDTTKNEGTIEVK